MDELKGDEIVISGISGIFPGTENVQQLSENLYNKVDMVKRSDKYPHIKHPEFPQHLGSINGMEKFDAHFFRVTSQQAVCMDPLMRKIMEDTMAAIFDAGVNPETLKDSKMGVYIASTTIDSFNAFFSDIKGHPFILTGSCKCMLANRISYWINSTGPSYTLDQGYVGSMSVLELAYQDLKANKIDCAVVGGCNYCIKPELTLNMKRAGLLCLDGKTKCFDKNGDGFVRSDATNVFFLQKAKDAKRIYSEVYHVKGKYFASTDGLFTPKRNPKEIETFLKEFYSEVDIDPKDVEYVEANSFGIAEADGAELEAIGNVFANQNSIKVGSVKSNMGHTESVSGACSITKLCLAYRCGQIPANLHYEEPQCNIPAIKEQKIEVVTEKKEFSRKFTAINNFCYTGSNFHALLKGHYKPKDNERYKSKIPRIILISSRKEEGVKQILDTLESNPIDPEQHALLNNIFKYYIPGYTARGYTILDTNERNETISLSRGFEYFSGNTRPVWFLYSGMGSQWPRMGEGLLRIPVFAAAIKRCHNVLHEKKLDLIDIITNQDLKKLNILKCFVAITAIQIGLTDVLTSIGIHPDKLIGHSLGEICCAYADGTLTMEQTILAAYFRALVSYETKFIKGTMAAVGLGYKEVVKLCPPGVEVACHNSFESATISGPSNVVAAFVKSLSDRGIFAKEVASFDIAFHSKYIAEAGPKMLDLLKTIIINPKHRSDKWLSTCYLPQDWHKQDSKYASAEYFTHNLMNSVLFEETASFIPEDAIVIEIAPHGLLQAIMKRSHSKCINVSLTRRNESDSVLFLLKTIGSLYQQGINADIESLYPKVEFPVSSETPLLSHLVKWDHDTNWKFEPFAENSESPVTKEYIFSAFDDDFNFLRNYLFNDVIILPEALVLVLVWKTLAKMETKNYKAMSVHFNDIKFHQKVSVPTDEIIKISVSILNCSGKFEVIHNKCIIADGIILPIKGGRSRGKILFNENYKYMTQENIKTLLKIRGYEYDKQWQSIKYMNIKRDKATIIWREQNGWTNFIDSFIKIQALSNDHDGLSFVKLINDLTIDTDEHKYLSFSSDGDECHNAIYTKETGVLKCGGVIIRDMVLEEIRNQNVVARLNQNLKINVSCNHNDVPNCNKYKIQRTWLIENELGNFESLSWADAPVASENIMIQVHYSGLSSKDVKIKDLFGMDFSGIDVNGKRVMGLIPGGAAASVVSADYSNDLVWPVPQHWSLADAATVPLPYVHALYCLTIRHTISKNDSILVIGAAGALGQAVISIALHIGCRIFGTVGNADKKRFLLRLFPQLDENNIGYTYNDTFRTMVIERTNNRRCNVVISTASGKIREDAMSCVGEEILNNFFLDVNESDQCQNEKMTMAYLDGDKTYKSINMSAIFKDSIQKDKQVIQLKLSEGILRGYIKPLTRVIYTPPNVTKAFQLLSSRCNIGRVLISIKELNNGIESNSCWTARLVLSPNKAYIVVCDGTELGVELINLLVKRGAKRLLIHCHPKTINGYFHARYASWKKAGVNIEINSDDLQLPEKCHNFIASVKSLGFVRVDGVFITYSAFTDYNVNLNLKKIVYNIDKETRDLKDLRYFAVIDAIAQDSSNISEENELESICVDRSYQRLPSLYLRHNLCGKNWNLKSLQVLFSGMETSLKHQYLSVSTASIDNKSHFDIEKTNSKFDAGFNAFFEKNTQHEFDATEPLVLMKTKITSAVEYELTVDPDSPKIILIPGFDGNSESLITVAERLKIPAIALQTDLQINESISETAKRYLNHCQARFRLKSPFFIMGYSFGVNIALEIAALLEKEGLVGVVYSLDSSPDAVRAHLDAYLGNLTEQQLQNSLIEHIYSIFTDCQSSELKAMLKETMKWTDKVELFINATKTDVSHSHDYLKNYLQTAYDRIKLAKEYKPDFVLQSELVLMKGIPHPNARDLSNDYNLSLYTNKPVQVFDIKSDHAMALTDCRVSNFLNKFIDNYCIFFNYQ